MFHFLFTNLNLSMSLKSYHAHIIPMHLITGTLTGFLIFFVVYFSIMSSEPSTEQAIKDLQAQNAQFQELFMNLAKGQQHLKTFILKEKKKKKRTILFNTGHKFGNRLRDEVDLTTSSGGKDSQEERRAPSPVVLDNETL